MHYRCPGHFVLCALSMMCVYVSCIVAYRQSTPPTPLCRPRLPRTDLYPYSNDQVWQGTHEYKVHVCDKFNAFCTSVLTCSNNLAGVYLMICLSVGGWFTIHTRPSDQWAACVFMPRRTGYLRTLILYLPVRHPFIQWRPLSWDKSDRTICLIHSSHAPAPYLLRTRAMRRAECIAPPRNSPFLSTLPFHPPLPGCLSISFDQS
jgi:hypothetical protein